MALTQIAQPFPIFTDSDGKPLDDGFIYIGLVQDNPETNPISVYWDPDFTLPAAQPIRTINGYPSQNGAPGVLYTNDQFSITVRDKHGRFVIYYPVGFGVIPTPVSGTVTIQRFNGDGVTTVFNLTSAPTSEDVTQIYVEGVHQSHDTYSIAGTAISFDEAPPVGAENIEVVVAQALGIVNPTIVGVLVDDLPLIEATAGMTTTAIGKSNNGDGGEGQFWFDSSNLSVEVALDTLQGIYVAPNSDPTGASGAWVRQFNGPVYASWFGALNDWTGAAGTDNYAAIMAAITVASTLGISFNFGAGEFLIGTGLTIPAGADVGGQGSKTKIVVNSDIVPITCANNNWRVRDFVLSPGPLAATSGAAMYITGNRWLVQNVEADNLNGGTFDIGFQTNGAIIGKFDRCIAQDNTSYGFHLYNSPSITLVACLSEENLVNDLYAEICNGLRVYGGPFEGSATGAPTTVKIIDSEGVNWDGWIENDAAGGYAMELDGVTGSRIGGFKQGGDPIDMIGCTHNIIGPFGVNPVPITLDAASRGNLLIGRFDSTDIVDNNGNNIIVSNLTPAFFQKQLRVDALPFDDSNREWLDIVYSGGSFVISTGALGTGTVRHLKLASGAGKDVILSPGGTTAWTVQVGTQALIGGAGAYITMPAITAATAAKNSIFRDSADNKLKYKDNGGTVNLLY